MIAELEAVTFDVPDATTAAAFWAVLLDRRIRPETSSAYLPGSITQVGLRFLTSSSEQLGPRRLHLHLTSDSEEDQRRTVATALELGGRHLDVGQGTDAEFVVLADPGGNELCVIDPGNRFLAGTGRLGEVTCEGSRAVGLFWSAALGWPLVWDEHEETAVQSPHGGTKISWGGPPVAPQQGRNRQRFDLVAGDPVAEVERLVALGASVLVARADGADLTDPDGNEFSLRAPTST